MECLGLLRLEYMGRREEEGLEQWFSARPRGRGIECCTVNEHAWTVAHLEIGLC